MSQEHPVTGPVGPAVIAVDGRAPIRVRATGGGCGGGRRIALDGQGLVRPDGRRPEALLVHAVDEQDRALVVEVRRGDRGVTPWPVGGDTPQQIDFHTVRLDGDRIRGDAVLRR